MSEWHRERRPMRIGVLISGSGTNLQAILDACAEGRLAAEVAVVVANHADAYGLARAEHAGVPAVFLDRTRWDSPKAYNDALLATLRDHKADVVVMAGYMRLLGRQVLEEYPARVLNIHPALLPSFSGAAGIRDAFDYGVKVTGVTVHFASERFDEGPIIAQEPVRLEEGDTVEALEARVHDVEHEIYPRVLQLLAEDRLAVDGRRVEVLDAEAAAVRRDVL